MSYQLMPVGRLRARLAAAVLTLTAVTILTASPTAHAAATPSGPVGPAPISPLGHPGLCWEAWGNGSAVTLETCDPALQGQSWTFTGHHDVLMNGNGYCADNGGATPSSTNGAPPAGSDTVFLSFSGQCAGSPSQAWTFSGSTNQIANAPAGVCAYVAGGALVRGAVIVARPCASAGRTSIWSMGVSDLALTAPHASAAHAATAGGADVKRDFTTAVEVSNSLAVSASDTSMTAYGAQVRFTPARGLTITRLTGTGDLAGWSCDARALRCQGNLGGGERGGITVLGSVTAQAPPATLTALVSVAHTNQSRRARHLTAVLPVRVFAAPAPVSAGGGPGSSVTTFALVAAVVLVLLGIFLAVVARRRRPVPPLVPVPPAGPQPETTPLPVASPMAETRDNTAVLPAVSPSGNRPLLHHRGRPAGYRRPRLTAPVRHARPAGRRRPDRNQDAAAGPPAQVPD